MRMTDSLVGLMHADGNEPVFNHPWEAHAFALTVKLHEHGAFDWKEWGDVLAQSIHANEAAPYYENWLDALESLVLAKGIIEARELHRGIEALNIDQ